MTAKRKTKMVVDMFMISLLPILMAYSLVGEAAHEWIGLTMMVLFLTHNSLNAPWYKNILKGRYSGIRILTAVINILLAGIMLSLMVSGILLSKHVFAALPVSKDISAARMVHLSASYWGLVLMSLHLGFHWKGMVQHLNNHSALRLCSWLIPLYGVYALLHRQLLTYMFLRNQYVFFDFSEPIVYFLLDYIAVMGLFVWLGYYIIKFLSNRKAVGKQL